MVSPGLVEFKAERQVLKAVWQVHSPQCLVEATSKCQDLKAGWQVHSPQSVPYHLWAKMWHPEDPPHLFWKPQKHVGWYISCGGVKYFSKFSCFTPPNIPGSKGEIYKYGPAQRPATPPDLSRPSPPPAAPWLCTKASWNLLRNPVKPGLALHQSLPDLLRNLLRNPVEPAPKPSRTFSRTFSGTLLNLTQSLPDLLRNLLRNPVEPEPSLEPSPEPYWTWLHFAPSLPGTFSETLLNLTWLCTKHSQTLSGTFCGTFSGVEPDLALRPSPEPSQPSPEPRWTWPGAYTSAHRNYSGLKTPLVYAVGENKQNV